MVTGTRGRGKQGAGARNEGVLRKLLCTVRAVCSWHAHVEEGVAKGRPQGAAAQR